MSGILTAMGVSQAQFLIGSTGSTDFELSPNDAYAEIDFRTDGGIYTHNGVKIGSWIFPNSLANSNWQIRATQVSGTIDYGTLNTWLSLGVSRSWAEEELAIGSDQSVLTIELRYNGGDVVKSRNYTITAEVDV